MGSGVRVRDGRGRQDPAGLPGKISRVSELETGSIQRLSGALWTVPPQEAGGAPMWTSLTRLPL